MYNFFGTMIYLDFIALPPPNCLYVYFSSFFEKRTTLIYTLTRTHTTIDGD